MTATVDASAMATWFALAGRVFVNPAAAEIRRLADQLTAGGEPDAAVSRLLEEMDAEVQRDPLTLEKEHVRLFLSPLGAPCPPWQSVHGKDQQLMGGPHLRALEWYRSERMEPQASNEPADHAGMLLTFLAYLLESDEEGDKLASFFEEHVRWMEPFLDSVCRQTASPFFSLAAFETKYRIGQVAGALEEAQ